MKRVLAILAAVVVLLAAQAQWALAAPSDFGLESITATLSTSKAGAHPDVFTSFAVRQDSSSAPNEFGLHDSFAATRDIRIELPPGLIGNPNAVAQCTVSQLQLSMAEAEGEGCPNASQVGVSKIYAYGLTSVLSEPVYMMEPPGGDVVARLGLIAGTFPTFIDVEARPERNYSLTATLNQVSGQQRLIKAETTLWGVPASPGHNTERQSPKEAFLGATSSPSRPPGGPQLPFLYNPTSCGAAQQVGIAADSYAEPGRFSPVSTELPPTVGCEELDFNPALSIQPTSHEAGAPTGLDADLTIPQEESALGRATSQLRGAVATLPQGMTVSSGAADGLLACTAEEVGFEKAGPSRCPEAAKIGTAEFDVPALSRVIDGAIYQRTPEPGKLFRIWLVADELGVHVKIAGEIHLDPQTGQVTSIFTETPQVPLRELKLHFRAGPRAPLANPATCGTYSSSYELMPWSGTPAVHGQAPMTIDQGCGSSGFQPGFAAGSSNPSAGSFSSFLVNVTRQQGEQNIDGLDVTLPPGLLAKLAGVPVCAGSGTETGACPVASQIGSVSVAAGPGSAPLLIPQPGKEPTAVFLAGPYKGAPYSLVIKVPAQAGPFDLGTVVTRAGLYVDPVTTQVTVKSDPLPQILEGVPISYRTIQVTVNRPEFTLNPTNCRSMIVGANLTSITGSAASASSRFQVGGCRGLAFSPKLALALKGGTKRAKNPAVRATLTTNKGHANISRTSVVLPPSEFIDNRHINNPCTRVQFAANACPAKSILGKVRAFTPLLDQPLEGPVYFRSNGGERELPDLVAVLNGAIRVELVGFIDSVRKKGSEISRVRTTFATVPDAPVSKFVLQLFGGTRGLLQNSANLCKAPQHAAVKMTGQNGSTHDFNQLISTSCGAKSPKKHH